MENGSKESHPSCLKFNNSRVVVVGNVISNMASSNTTGTVPSIKLDSKNPKQWNPLVFRCDFTWVIRDFETWVNILYKFDFLGNGVSPFGVAILFVKSIGLIDRPGDLDTKLILDCLSSSLLVQVGLFDKSIPFLPIVNILLGPFPCRIIRKVLLICILGQSDGVILLDNFHGFPRWFLVARPFDQDIKSPLSFGILAPAMVDNGFIFPVFGAVFIRLGKPCNKILVLVDFLLSIGKFHSEIVIIKLLSNGTLDFTLLASLCKELFPNVEVQ